MPVITIILQLWWGVTVITVAVITITTGKSGLI
jgi:hypothetical protein